MSKITDKRFVKFYFIILAFLWTLAVAASLTWSFKTTERHIEDTALAQARMAMTKDVMYRRWVSSKGGFYMPMAVIAPNPYLTHVKKRDITTTDGVRLTLINPAYMTRLVYEFSEDETRVRTRLVSDKLVNPINKAKGWEVPALDHVLKTRTEYYGIEPGKKTHFCIYGSFHHRNILS